MRTERFYDVPLQKTIVFRRVMRVQASSKESASRIAKRLTDGLTGFHRGETRITVGKAIRHHI